MIAVDLGASVAAEGEFFGHKVQRSGGVLYVACEGAGGIPQRFAAWTHGKSDAATEAVASKVRLVRDSLNLLDPADAEKLVRTAKREHERDPLALVIVDTLSASIPSGDENQQKDATAVLHVARTITLATSAAVLFVHHANKPKTSFRGSSVFGGNVDVILEAARDGAVFGLKCTKQKDRGTPSVSWRFGAEVVTLDDGETSVRVGSVLVRDPSATDARPGLSVPEALRRAVDEMVQDSPGATQWRSDLKAAVVLCLARHGCPAKWGTVFAGVRGLIPEEEKKPAGKRLSTALRQLKKAGHVEKAGALRSSPWTLTEAGRRAYSGLIERALGPRQEDDSDAF
jgi:hypothetical protein